MTRNRGSLIAALFLIILGVWFLLVEMVPEVRHFAYESNNWPIPILGVGLLFLLAALIARVPGLLIPGTIILGIGTMLYYQNATGDWESWAYAWSLIPGFVGLGLLLAGVFSRKRGMIQAAMWCLLVSVVLFGVFGSTLGNLSFGKLLWPAALILLGLAFLLRPLFPARPKA